MLLWPTLFAILPFLAVLARWSAPPEALAAMQQSVNAAVEAAAQGLGEEVSMAPTVTYPGGTLLWIGIGVALAVLRLGHMCFTCVHNGVNYCDCTMELTLCH